MDSNFKSYDHVASAGRIKEYLTGAQGSYEEVDSLPDRDKLTFTNGYYANCSAIFVDIRGSSQLPKDYKRPRLARIYRAYLSELVAIFNGSPLTREVNIAGDAAWAVVNTPSKPNIDSVFAMGYRANSMVQVLNHYMKKADYGSPIKIGVGMSWGRALMIKAGYNGSGINDVVYMGDVVNEAAKLANYGNSQWGIPALVASDDFHHNLNKDNQAVFKRDFTRGCYTTNVFDAAMEDWYQTNCT
ncbi:adenylate/guanylate cyclase domain-containing protein [Streptomyces europaeiscabiei]|uniref:adenylate/guanylate cyclase domain-containing protein n=1 Tax=Streptomyces europaeiscabiei TaxID=146819 RepID=UPI0029A2D235|nr:adenylate/guanylate cyclase domain-containing protein [Streptomyces europaeiscabiei]MDX3839518.1 adenylate/guanylate cyclase domain-containing protein [Streptomyces europaeiscabiei]